MATIIRLLGWLNRTGDRLPSGLLPVAAGQAVPDGSVPSPWDIWYGSDILEEARLVMGPHLGAKPFYVSGVGLEVKLRIIMPEYTDGGDGQITPFCRPVQLFVLDTLPQSDLRPAL